MMKMVIIEKILYSISISYILIVLLLLPVTAGLLEGVVAVVLVAVVLLVVPAGLLEGAATVRPVALPVDLGGIGEQIWAASK